MIHTVKVFSVVNEVEVDVFLEFFCFFIDPEVVGNLSSDSSAFSKSSLNIWKFLVHILLMPSLENLGHYFASVWDEWNCTTVWKFIGTSFFLGLEWKLNISSPVATAGFSKFAGILSANIIFLCFFALITEDVFLISPCYSLELCIQIGISFLFSFAFCFSSFHAICKASSHNHLPFCISFYWGWSWSMPLVQCHEPPSIVLQANCLSDLIPWIYSSLPLYNYKAFDLGHTWMV